MASRYAYFCTLCHHLASRHYLAPDGQIVKGPYVCSHKDCTCGISQTTPVSGIDEATFNRVFLPHLSDYANA